MSLSNLFVPNNYDIYCDSITCNSITVEGNSPTWLLYTPTIQVGSNIATTFIDFYDGVYYRVRDGFLELQFRAETNNSTDASPSKFMTIDTPPGVTLALGAGNEGAGGITASGSPNWAADNTVWTGSGTAFRASATTITFFINTYNTPSGASNDLHYMSGNFIGPIA